MLKLDRSKISLTTLRNHKEFRMLVDLLEQELDNEREVYETSTANDYLRGRVVMLREIINTVKGS